jgi:hypothetical protein
MYLSRAAKPIGFRRGRERQLFNERIDLRDLCTAITTPQTLDNRPIQMQSSGQCGSVEFTALAAEDRAENSEVLKFQRERIRTRRSSFSLVVQIKTSLRTTPKMMGLDSNYH